MRTRETIEKQINPSAEYFPLQQGECLIIELLLDIRDLLDKKIPFKGKIK